MVRLPIVLTFLSVASATFGAALKLEFLQHDLQPIEGYSATVCQNGFQVPVKWADPGKLKDRIRVRVRFEGEKKTGIRLHAIYLQ